MVSKNAIKNMNKKLKVDAAISLSKNFRKRYKKSKLKLPKILKTK